MTNVNVSAVFDQSAGVYDRSRRQLVPCFDDFYGRLLDLIPCDHPKPCRVLDLGAGTGLLSLFITERLPGVELTLVDISEQMLARARERLAGRSIQVEFIVADYATASLPQEFDTVVSALSIHHLTDQRKAELFGRIYRVLVPGGTFLNADQVAGPTPAVDQQYREAWLRQVRGRGVSSEDLAAALERMKEDKMAPLDSQLSWLKAAGFEHVACWYQNFSFVVFGGRKVVQSARAT